MKYLMIMMILALSGCASPPHLSEKDVVMIVTGPGGQISDYEKNAKQRCPAGTDSVKFLYSGPIGIGLANALYFRCLSVAQ